MIKRNYRYPLASSTWDSEEYRRALGVFSNDIFTMSDNVKEFQQKYAEWAGVKYSVFCNSGSSANLLALSALKYDPRLKHLHDKTKIIVPSVSWSTTYSPALQLGFDLQFVDVDPYTFNIDVNALKNIDTSDVFALFAVNLLGNPCDYSYLRAWCKEEDVLLLEDNCESMGATFGKKKTGSFGLVGTHSTFYSHHMATMEGGICTTDDELTYEILKSLRAHGWVRNVENKSLFYEYFEKPKSNFEENFHFVLPGYNFRPTEVSAAIGLAQLDKIDGFLNARRTNAIFMKEQTKNLDGIRLQECSSGSSWFGFGFVLDEGINRKEVLTTLDDAGIETRPIVSGNMVKQPCFKGYDDPEQYLGAEIIGNRGFMIGNHQKDISSEINIFIEIVRKIL